MLLGHPIDLKAKTGGEKSMSEKEEACTRRAGADDGFTASHCGLSGTGS